MLAHCLAVNRGESLRNGSFQGLDPQNSIALADKYRMFLIEQFKNVNQFSLQQLERVIAIAKSWPQPVPQRESIQHYIDALQSKHNTRVKVIANHNVGNKCIEFKAPTKSHETWIFERVIDSRYESERDTTPIARIYIREREIESHPHWHYSMELRVMRHSATFALPLLPVHNPTTFVCLELIYQEEAFEFHPTAEYNIKIKDFYLRES